MKTINKEVMSEIDVYEHNEVLTIDFYDCDSMSFDKQGAAELIKVLQEWVDEKH